MRNLRIHFQLPGNCGFFLLKQKQGINWTVLQQLTALERLEVSITFKTEYLKRRVQRYLTSCSSQAWKDSFIVNGFIKSMTEALPARVVLVFGSWEALLTQLEARKGRDSLVDPDILVEIYDDYQRMRGRKCLENTV